MRRLAAILALALAACSTEPPAREVATMNTADRFSPGDVLRYRFEWKVESSAITGILPGRMPIDAGMHLAGEVALRVLPRAGEHAVLGISIARLDRGSITLMGQDAVPQTGELVGHEIFATVDDDGDVLAIHHDARTPPLVMHVLPGLLAQIDLRVPTPEQTRRVPTGAGLADVEYAWSAPGHVARTLHGYARLDAFDGDDRADAAGRLDATLDDRGLPTHITVDEQLATPAAIGEESPFRSHTSFVLERIAVEHDELASAPELDTLVSRDPDAPPDSSEAERVLAQRFAEDLDAADVAIAVHGAAAGLSPSHELLVRATGRLRGWPETAEELVPLFQRYDRPRARSLIADLLSSAGTPEAQAVLCELLGDPAAQAEREHAGWMQRFAFVTQPMPGTAQFLLDEHERSRALVESRALQAVLYPMGSVARNIAATDPVAATALRSRLRETLRTTEDSAVVVAALAGLGNAGAPEDLEDVLAYERSELPVVRVAVANALERQSDERASMALLRLIADDDGFVADAALTSLDGRGAPGDPARLAVVALSGSFVPELAGRLTSALARHRDDDPTVPAALLAMRAQTENPRERDRIDGVLASTVE